MTSPFPGMDPYLEQFWRDVHLSLIAQTRQDLNRFLPQGLLARAEERVVIDDDSENSRHVYPDVEVVTFGGGGSVAMRPDREAALPVLLLAESEPAFQRYIEIVDAQGGQVVTAIEFLSPTNKTPGRGRDSYTQKRDEFRSAQVNVVEIDLVRAGNRAALLPPVKIPEQYDPVAYRACVYRARNKKAAIEFYPIELRDKLPVISIPLRASDQDVALDLQRLVDHVYTTGRYSKANYSKRLEPPLSAEDAVWAWELVKAHFAA